jgi:hypothetical protein
MSGSNSFPTGDNAEPEALALSVHASPAATSLVSDPRTRRGRRIMITVWLLCALPVIASYLTFYVFKPSGQAYGDLQRPTSDMPTQLHLRQLDGQAVDVQGLKGQWLLIVIDGGSCLEGCEDRLFMQRQLREMLGRDRDRLDKVWLVVDDAPIQPKLRESLEATPAMHILRADREALAAWLKPATGHSLADHLYLVDPMGRWMWRAPVKADPQRVKKDLSKLLKAANSWDQPGRSP